MIEETSVHSQENVEDVASPTLPGSNSHIFCELCQKFLNFAVRQSIVEV